MTERILIADDSLSMREAAANALARRGALVEIAADGVEALARLRAAPLSLLIADVHMPGHDGYALCRTARSEHPGVRVLLMVGTFEPFDSAAASAAGADAVLRKPFVPDELQRKVEELLGPMAAPRPGPVPSPEEVAARPVSAPSPPPAAPAAAGAGEPGRALSDDDVERIARRVLALGGEAVLERVARELLGKAAACERVPPAAGRGALDGDPERE